MGLLLLNSQLLRGQGGGGRQLQGKRVGRWGWVGVGQGPAFSVDLVGVSFHGLLQKPP